MNNDPTAFDIVKDKYNELYKECIKNPDFSKSLNILRNKAHNSQKFNNPEYCEAYRNFEEVTEKNSMMKQCFALMLLFDSDLPKNKPKYEERANIKFILLENTDELETFYLHALVLESGLIKYGGAVTPAFLYTEIINILFFKFLSKKLSQSQAELLCKSLYRFATLSEEKDGKLTDSRHIYMLIRIASKIGCKTAKNNLSTFKKLLLDDKRWKGDNNKATEALKKADNAVDCYIQHGYFYTGENYLLDAIEGLTFES